MLTDYSDLEKEIEDAPETKTLPRGSEVKARIIAVYPGENESTGVRFYRLVFDIPAQPEVKEFQIFMNELEDREKMEANHRRKALRNFGDFRIAFGLDISRPFSWEDDLINLEGWVILGVKKSDEYGDQNTVSRFVVGK